MSLFESDFLLVCGDVIANISLEQALEEHRYILIYNCIIARVRKFYYLRVPLINRLMLNELMVEHMSIKPSSERDNDHIKSGFWSRCSNLATTGYLSRCSGYG